MANIGANNLPNLYKTWANSHKALVENSYKKGKDFREGIFYMDSTENWEDRMVETEGLDAPSRWDDGETASQSEIKEGYKQTFTQVPYGEEVPFGRLMRKFQAKDARVMKRAMTQLGKVFYRMEQRAAFSMLGYGFSTTNTYLTGITGATVSALGPDGKNLFSVAHPCGPNNATTWANVITSSPGVTENALKLFIENLDGQQDPTETYNGQLDAKGEKKHYGTDMGYVWMVSKSDLPAALRIVNSDLRPGTANNDDNVYQGGFDGVSIEVRCIPWLSDFGSTKAHFFMAKEVVDEEMPLNVLTNEAFATDDYTDDRTKTAYVRASEIFTVGFLSGRGIVASNGTGVAYTS